MIRIAIFASGNGSNAEQMMQYFEHHKEVEISLLLSNNPKAFALQRAAKRGVPKLVFNREMFYQTEDVLDVLKQNQIDIIVLAGFLWLIPSGLIQAYPGRIINIHPALLPKYGGKGMYGMHVHEAVIANHEKQSGITIHLVNEQYDEGNIIFQAVCDVSPEDTPETLAEKVHALEYAYFPQTIAQFIQDL